MELEQLLIQLAAQTERALAIWEALMRADEDNGYDEDEEIEGTLWLTLEHTDNPLPGGFRLRSGAVWSCGYRVQIDEATLWALRASGSTPLAAAQALLA